MLSILLRIAPRGISLIIGMMILSAEAQGIVTDIEVIPQNPAQARSANLKGKSRILASAEGAKLNSNLFGGGGTDDTQLLQRLLDRAASGPALHVIIDGPALVTGLSVHGNTTIECTAGGGFYLSDGSPGSIIRNAHRSRDKVMDRHIEIRGCFFNGNHAGQQGSGPGESLHKAVQESDRTFKSGLQFLGIEHLKLTDISLINVTSFGAWVANAQFVDIRNVVIDSGLPPYPPQADPAEHRSYYFNYGRSDDALHFNGPIRYLTVDGAKLRTWDDGIALNANDYGVEDLTSNNEMGPYIGQGPITDVFINNVMFMDSQHGIRLLSVDQDVDRVVIQNIMGRVRGRMAVISPFRSGNKGQFGSLLFSNVNMDPIPFPHGNELFPDSHESAIGSPQSKLRQDFGEEAERPLFSLNGLIENLSLHRLVINPVDSRPLIRIGSHAKIGALNASMTIYDPELHAVPVQLLGEVDLLTLSIDWRGTNPIKRAGGSVHRLRLKRN